MKTRHKIRYDHSGMNRHTIIPAGTKVERVQVGGKVVLMANHWDTPRMTRFEVGYATLHGFEVNECDVA